MPGKRKTPGLRREEVAVLAGIGTSWYTWLEQGRAINVSEPVARAICQALRLSRSETTYLYRLLGITPPTGANRGPALPAPDLHQVVDEWLPNPAIIVDDLWNLLDYNSSARLVFDLSGADRNLLASFFTRDNVRARYVHQQQVARMAVAQFRVCAAHRYDDPAFTTLIDDLCARSDQFACLWSSHEVSDVRLRTKEIEHPEVGRLSFDMHSWQLDGPEPVRLFLHTPHRSSATRHRLDRLLVRHHESESNQFLFTAVNKN